MSLSSLLIHDVVSIRVEKVRELGITYTRNIHIKTNGGYLEITCFSDDKETLLMKGQENGQEHRNDD